MQHLTTGSPICENITDLIGRVKANHRANVPKSRRHRALPTVKTTRLRQFDRCFRGEQLRDTLVPLAPSLIKTFRIIDTFYQIPASWLPIPSTGRPLRLPRGSAS